MSAFPRGPWTAITPAALATGLGSQPIVVADAGGHAAAACYRDGRWCRYVEDRTRPPLDFEPTVFSRSAPVRPGFVVEPVA